MSRSQLLLIRLTTLCLFLALGLSSCSVKRFIPQDEKLLRNHSVKIEYDTAVKDRTELEYALQRVVRPRRNAKLAGTRLSLLVYYKAQRDKPGFLNKWLNKKIGEEPVYLSDVDVSRTQELLENRLENNGFFYPELESETTSGKHFGSVKYKVKLGVPYTIEKYELDTGSQAIYREIQKAMGDTELAPGTRFSLDKLRSERERIDSYLKSRGYYNFNADFLIFEADTNQYSNRKFDLFLRLKKDVPLKSVLPYVIDRVNVYPDNSLSAAKTPDDTVRMAGITFIQKPIFFKPRHLVPYVLLRKGQHYNPEKSKKTSKWLGSIGAYEFVNIRYSQLTEPTADTDSLRLNADIFLSPLKKRSLRAELRAVTKSNGFAGPTVAAVYSNRNLFRGGETLNLTTSFGYENQVGGEANTGLSSTQIGLQGDLIFPRLFLPFRVNKSYLYSVPATKVSLGFDFFDRSQLYSLNSLEGVYGYRWRTSRSVYHELNPLSINYVNTSNVSEEFQEILDQNLFLASSFRQQLILGINYTLVYNQLTNPRKKHPILLVANFDVAGNALGWLGEGEVNENGRRTIFDIEYAQYAKADFNFVYHRNVGIDQQLVGRVFAGIGLPYGNAESLPFAKQFFSGGPASVRAFRTRSLGPGSYAPAADDRGAFFDRSGDIRLEFNLEYRFPIIPYLKGALFVDAGNVWLSQENTALPGGKFSSKWLEELGAGTGAGLRIDIQNFVIRLDAAAPFRKPFLPENERLNFDLSDIIFNFAIGYPF